jgi:hypothetical protein
MQASARNDLPARLHPVAAMAHLLERLERSPSSASASQYQGVVQQITRLLAAAEPDGYLDAVLAAYPATAELYENLRYEHAGLCRSPFETSLGAEMAAVAAIEQARRRR